MVVLKKGFQVYQSYKSIRIQNFLPVISSLQRSNCSYVPQNIREPIRLNWPKERIQQWRLLTSSNSHMSFGKGMISLRRKDWFLKIRMIPKMIQLTTFLRKPDLGFQISQWRRNQNLG